MKFSTAAVTCAGALVASLAACGGGSEEAAPPSQNGGSTPSTTATDQPATTPAAAPPTVARSGPVVLPAHSTYTYGDLRLVVNLPDDAPQGAHPSLRFFSEFLQARGRTTAANKIHPSLSGLASANVLKNVRTGLVRDSVQGIGSVTYTIDKVRTVGSSGFAVITGCVDQSQLSHVRKDGSHFVAGAKDYPTLKMTAEINPGPRVTDLAFAVGTCG